MKNTNCSADDDDDDDNNNALQLTERAQYGQSNHGAVALCKVQLAVRPKANKRVNMEERREKDLQGGSSGGVDPLCGGQQGR